MKREYHLHYEGSDFPFTIESEHEEAFKAFEGRMRLYKRIKDFYNKVRELRQSVILVDNAFDVEKEYLDLELQEVLDMGTDIL